MKIESILVYLVVITAFALDYFLLSNEAQKTQTCAFYAVITLFNIWATLLKTDKNKV